LLIQYFYTLSHHLKRVWNIARYTLLSILLLLVLLWLAIQTSPVQNYLARKVTEKLSHDLQTTISIKKVEFGLFNRMLLEGTLIEDRNKDTLLYAGTAEVRITDWFFFKDKVELKYIGLKDAQINFQRTDSVWNYKFLADYFSGSPQKKEQRSIEYNFHQIDLENVAFVTKDGWRGENQIIRVGALKMDPQDLDMDKRLAYIRTLKLVKPEFFIYNYQGNRPDSLRPKTITKVIDPHSLRWNLDNWDVAIDQLSIEDGVFKNDVQTEREPYPYFDGAHILFSNINGEFNHVRFTKDTVTADVRLQTRERSGFVVKSMVAKMKWHPELMEFSNLDVRTNQSHLRNYFAMRYATFDDMNDFIGKVVMEGKFNGSEIYSDDIAFFAPELKSWDKSLKIEGHVKGTVANLRGENILLSGGRSNNTFLSGDVTLSGLPDIDNTYIDFSAKDFRTTYADAVRMVPALKKVGMPRIDRVDWLRFKGNFTGFLKDFVTYGTIQTNLGTITSDLNMKLHGSVPSYSGKINVRDFKLGAFLDNDQLGNLSFRGNIKGKGFSIGYLDASLDGTVDELSFNGYDYHDIAVNGDFKKKLFNGKLHSNDPNLALTLEGIIDLNNAQPRFNFNAQVENANLQKLNFYGENIDFNGKLNVDFTGDDIDNFIGIARIYDASLYRNGKRFSFDSLVVESKISENNKTLTVLSNEFDAALAGEFSIRQLPAAFQTFLNRYYPTYIKPSKNKLQNENFSFVVTTKNVDEYIKLVDPNLAGFDFSTVSGRINSDENLLDLSVEVPEFKYKHFSFQNTVLKGRGTLDSLVLEASVADTYVNDSLHLPETYLRVNSANDLSLVRLKTSANTTLNSADIVTRVQTLKDGVRIYFDPTSFVINGKEWRIDKNGELVLSKNLITAENVRISSGEQEIFVTTVPSEIGNSNDLKVSLRKINVGDFTPFVVSGYRIEGLLSADVNIVDPFGKMEVAVEGQADQLRLDNDSIGLVKLSTNYSQRSGRIDIGANSNNKDFVFDVNGFLAKPDSLGNREMNIGGHFTNISISPLKKYLTSVFSDVEGTATGDLKMVGAPSEMKLLGKMQVTNAKLKVDYTKVTYTIPTASVDFGDGYIDFGTTSFKDEKGNVGHITRARLNHRAFKKMSFDFAINTNKLLLLDTKEQDNSEFYGKVVGRANFKLTGPQEDMQMDIEGEPVDTSRLWLPSGTSRESADADFIVWKVYGTEMQPSRSSTENNLHVRMDITANDLATIYVVLDELTGDMVQANGEGNLIMTAGTNEDFTINGRYDIHKGNYLFTFQSLLKKPFTLIENSGNYISWTGDPYDARMKIDALYQANNVKFSDLNLEQMNYSINQNVSHFKGTVNVIAHLTGKLMKPDIGFDIQLPENSALRNDQDAQWVLQKIQNDENEKNKQVAFLVVFNSFGPLTSTQGSNIVAGGISNVVVNSISGFIANQVSRELSKAFEKSFGITFNFSADLYSGTQTGANSTNTIDRSAVTFQFAKSIMDGRLTFTFGSALDFGLTAEQAQAAAFQFLPDFTAEWKIRPDGRLLLTLFYRDSYNYIYSGKENRSGVSISNRREFDNLDELFHSRKKKKPPVPQTNKSDSTVTATGSQ
jgi:hypothetical protein